MSKARSPLPIPMLECPLGDEHCDQLSAALQSCNDAKCYLDRLAALGLDVSGWRQHIESNEALASGLKELHFPNRP